MKSETCGNHDLGPLGIVGEMLTSCIFLYLSGMKSGASSNSSSSAYPSSLSSLSSGATTPSSPEVHRPLFVNPLQRTQSTSDASSSSAGSKEAKSHSTADGFTILKSVEEDVAEGSASKDDDDNDAEVCSSQEDLFGQVLSGEAQKPKGREHVSDGRALSSQEVSKLYTPQHQSTPMGGSQQRSQEPPQEKSLYKQALTRHATSTPLEGGEGRTLPTPPSEGFSCLQFSGSVRETSSSSSDAMISPSPEAYGPVPTIIPSSPTAPKEKREESTAAKTTVEDPSHTGLVCRLASLYDHTKSYP